MLFLRKSIILGFSLFSFGLAYAETAKEVIQKVDENNEFKSRAFIGTMEIKRGNKVQVKAFVGFGEDLGKKSLLTFTNREDAGVKYLKLENELWIYFKDADDIMKISGHMLKQGVMGSDISYEDMLSQETLEEDYSYNLLENKNVNNIECYVVELEAKRDSARYEKQMIYVDAKKYVPIKTDLFAKGGRHIKTIEQSDIQEVQGKYIPFSSSIADLRKKDSITTVKYSKIELNIDIPAEVFTRNYLKK